MLLAPKQFTSKELKEREFGKFAELIREQFKHGGSKYGLSESKEATDHIMEVFGIDWVLGTMMKYILRFRNQGREKDLLKIATYAYIVWLVMCFNEKSEHDIDIAYGEVPDQKKFSYKFFNLSSIDGSQVDDE